MLQDLRSRSKSSQLAKAVRQRQNSENRPPPHNQSRYAYQKLSPMDIQRITRSVMSQPRALERNIGVISSIKGKMYCLQLGQVTGSRDFRRYFYCEQFRPRPREPLGKISHNATFSDISH